MPNNTIKHLKKLPLLLSTAAFSLAVTQASLAQTDPTQDPNASVVQAIQKLGSQIAASTYSVVNSANHMAYEVNQRLSHILPIDTEQQNANSIASSTADQDTQNFVTNYLSILPSSTLTSSSSGQADAQAAQDTVSAMSTIQDKYTVDLPASDTIWSAVSGISSTAGAIGYDVSKPTQLHDNYFTSTALLGPDAYSTDQQQAAEYYINFLTRNYTSAADGLDLTTLKNYLAQFAGNDPQTLAADLYQVIDSANYKKFQLNLRSYMASQSTAVNDLNDMRAERTPITTTADDPKLDQISQLMGYTPTQAEIDDPNNSGSKITQYTYPSPYQITKYMATSRVSDNNWHKNLAAAPVADLLRQLVTIQAENENLAFIQHQDNEKLRLSLDNLNIQLASTSQAQQQQLIQDVNTTISQVTGQPSSTEADTTQYDDDTTTTDASGDTTTTDASGQPTTTDTTGTTTDTTGTTGTTTDTSQ